MNWLRRLFARNAIPPAPSDMLGAATLPSVVLDTRGDHVPRSALDLIAYFEGYSATAYRCPAGVWTIGYGNTRFMDGRPVHEGDTITQTAARELLEAKANSFAREVDRLVTVPLAEHERAALISFAFNLGPAALARSTLLRRLNASDRAGAAAEFGRWTSAGGQVLRGLVRRREAEARLFRGEG